MPIIEAALITAAAVTVAYYAPFIIATTAAVVGSISTAIAGYYVGKAKTAQESDELKALRQELIKREQRVRNAASKLAEQTGQDVEHLLKQSKKHRKQVGEGVQTLTKRVVQMDEVAVHLDETNDALNIVTHDAALQVEAMEQAMGAVKLELASLNLKLRNAQKALLDREHELTVTFDKLKTTQEALDESTQKGGDKIIELTAELFEVQALLKPVDGEPEVKNAEFKVLHEENARLSNHIHALEKTIKIVSSDMSTTSETNRAQLDEIKTLHFENGRLNKAIKSLSSALDTQRGARQDSHHHKPGPRLF